MIRPIKHDETTNSWRCDSGTASEARGGANTQPSVDGSFRAFLDPGAFAETGQKWIIDQHDVSMLDMRMPCG